MATPRFRIGLMWMLASLVTMWTLQTGCGPEVDDSAIICDQAAQHVATCMKSDVLSVGACDTEMATQILGTSCDSLAGALAEAGYNKADSTGFDLGVVFTIFADETKGCKDRIKQLDTGSSHLLTLAKTADRDEGQKIFQQMKYVFGDDAVSAIGIKRDSVMEIYIVMKGSLYSFGCASLEIASLNREYRIPNLAPFPLTLSDSQASDYRSAGYVTVQDCVEQCVDFTKTYGNW